MKNGWQKRTLGETFVTVTGSTPPKNNTEFYGNFMPLVKPPELVDLPFDSAADGLSEAGAAVARTLPPESILVSCIGNLGKIGINTVPVAFNQQINAILPDKKQAIPEFMFYQVLSSAFKEQLDGLASGTTVPIVNKSRFNSIKIVIAPLTEQQRIVGILDEAFDGIATAKANAEKNLQNARALFESHLNSVFTQHGPGWDRVTLETLLERGWIESHLDGNHGGDYPRKEEFISEGVPYISANCLDDERIDMTRAKYLSPSRAALLRKGIAKDNDVLFAHNATVGPVAILRTTEEKVILGTSLTYYRCSPKHILPEYLAHYMRSFGFKTQYLQVMRQSTRNQVPITKQREFFHVIPPLDEQKRIIGALDGLLESGQRLESIYKQKLAALEELKKSLLDQAFTGAL